MVLLPPQPLPLLERLKNYFLSRVATLSNRSFPDANRPDNFQSSASSVNVLDLSSRLVSNRRCTSIPSPTTPGEISIIQDCLAVGDIAQPQPPYVQLALLAYPPCHASRTSERHPAGNRESIGLVDLGSSLDVSGLDCATS